MAATATSSAVELRSAHLSASGQRLATFDPKTRQFPAVILREGFVFKQVLDEATGTAVMVRCSFERSALRTGYLDRGLAFVHEHVDESRLTFPQLGKCLADWSIVGPVGARQLQVTVRLDECGEDPARNDVIRAVERGVLTGLSARIRLLRLEETGEERDGRPLYEATDWEVSEATVCTIQRDPNAALLSNGDSVSNSCNVVRLSHRSASNGVRQSHEGTAMPDGNGADGGAGGDPSAAKPGAPGAAVADPPEAKLSGEPAAGGGKPAAGGDALEAALAAESARAEAIVKLGAEHGVDGEVVRDLIKRRVSVADAGLAMLSHLKATRGANLPAGGGVRPGESQDEKVGAVMRAYLETRLGVLPLGSEEARLAATKAKPFLGRPIAEATREFLRMRGHVVDGLTAEGIAKLAFAGQTPADMPLLLQSTVERSVHTTYQAQPGTWRKFARQIDATDFRQRGTAALGLGSALTTLNPGQPISFGKVSENGELYTPARYAGGLAFDWMALANDDLSQLDAGRALGVQADLAVNRVCWALLTANANMRDGNPVIGTAHKNSDSGNLKLTSSGGIQALRTLARKQTDPDGNTLNLDLAGFILPVEWEESIRQIVAQTNPTAASGVQVYAGLPFTVEPMLSAASTTRWYAYADPALLPLFEVAFVGGRMPKIETWYDPKTKSLLTSVTLDFGAVIPNHRGIYSSLGTV